MKTYFSYPICKALALAAMVLALDYGSKAWALAFMQARAGEPLEVTPFFNLVLVWNHGISFGMLAHQGGESPLIPLLIAFFMLLVLAHWLRKTTQFGEALALGAIMGGAIGNVIDRLTHGAVVDFLDFHAFGQHWPAFNMADSAICCSVIFLCWLSLRATRKKEPA